MQKKILIIHAHAVSPHRPRIIGGAEVSVGILARSFAAKSEYRVYLASVSDAVSEMEEIEEGPITHLIFPINRPAGFGKSKGVISKAIWHGIDDLGFAPTDFARIVNTHKFSMAILNNMSGFGWRSAKILKDMNVPVILTLRDYYYLCAKMNLFSDGETCKSTCIRCRIFTHFRRNIFDHADRVVCVSEEMMALFKDRAGLTDEQIRFVHNPVEADLVGSVDRPWPETRIGFLGRNTEEKGLSMLIDAIDRMETKPQLVIAGAFSPAQQAEVVAGRNVDVRFLGFCPPRDLFERIDVLAVPSLWEEPFARVVLEATAFNIPSVVSSHGGLPAGVQYGQSGWIVSTDRAEDWAVTLEKIDKHSPEYASKVEKLDGALEAFSTKKYVEFFERQLEELTSAS